MVVIGGGQAGLSAGHHLIRAGARPADTRSARAGRDHHHGRRARKSDHPDLRAAQGDEMRLIMLDAEQAPGGAWRHRWDSLTMATVNHIADLPDMPTPSIPPEAPANLAVPAYFSAFERELRLPIERPVRVGSVREQDPDRPGGPLLIESAGPDGTELETIRTRALINATGTWNTPFVPYVPGRASFRGTELHTVGYTRAEDFRGRRVGVIGGGISAVGFLAELSEVTDTRWYTRREPVFHEGSFQPEIDGRAAVARVEERVREGLPPRSVVSVTGLVWTPALRAAEARGGLERRPMFTQVLADGVREADGTHTDLDVLLWATGFRASLGHLRPLHLHGHGGGIRMDGTQVAADPRIHLVGYGPSSSTIGANRAGRAAVRALRRHLT